jgi:hypothetical protein
MRLLKNVAISGLIAAAVGITCFIGAGQFVLYYNGGPGPAALDNNAGVLLSRYSPYSLLCQSEW